MAYVYILECADGSYYVGSAKNPDNRMEQHCVGVADSYTSSRRPVHLAWFQECERIDDAFALERKIKGWRRAKRLALIEGRLSDLPALSKSGAHAKPPRASPKS